MKNKKFSIRFSKKIHIFLKIQVEYAFINSNHLTLYFFYAHSRNFSLSYYKHKNQFVHFFAQEIYQQKKIKRIWWERNNRKKKVKKFFVTIRMKQLANKFLLKLNSFTTMLLGVSNKKNYKKIFNTMKSFELLIRFCKLSQLNNSFNWVNT